MQVDDRGGLLLGVAGLFQRLLRKDQVVLPGADVVLDLVDAVVPGILLLHDVGPVSYTHLDVYKRQCFCRAFFAVILAPARAARSDRYRARV